MAKSAKNAKGEERPAYAGGARAGQIALVAQFLRTALRAKPRGACVVIGAGMSTSAGLPDANGLLKIVRERFPTSVGMADIEGDAAVACHLAFGALSVGERAELIDSLVEGAVLNWEHLLLADLIARGYIGCVLSANFDQLLVTACATCGVAPTVYDCALSPEAAAYAVGSEPGPTLVYLHGQRHHHLSLADARELDSHHRRLAPLFHNLLHQGMPVIVVGYSGADEMAMPYLAAHGRFRNRLFWVGHGESPPEGQAADMLKQRINDAYFVSGYTAEGFFTALADSLHILPPAFVEDPAALVGERLRAAKQPESPELARRVDAWAERLVGAAKPQQERVEPAPPKSQASPATGEESKVDAPRLRLVVGDHQGLVDDHAAGLLDSAEGREAAASALVVLGNEFAERAVATGADGLWQQACDRYKEALEIHPDMREALLNWASALHVQAQSKSGLEAATVWADAVIKYEAALRLRFDDPETLTDCANALIALARFSPEAEAEELLTRALDKLKGAYALGDGAAFVGLLEVALVNGLTDELVAMLKKEPASLNQPCRFVLALITLIARLERGEPFNLDPFDALSGLAVPPCDSWDFQDYDSVIARLGQEDGRLIESLIAVLQGHRALSEWPRLKDEWLISRAHRIYGRAAKAG